MATNFFEQNTIQDIYEEMQAVYLNDKRPWIIGYSGGKDSTVVVELVFHMLLNLPQEKRHKPVYVISSDTLIENPLILGYLKNNIDLINISAKEQNIPLSAKLVTPDPKDSFWANVIGRGYPTPKSIQYRWCTERLKIRPSNKFIQSKLEQEDVVVLLGVRKSESMARRNRMEKREIEGYVLTPHETLKGKDRIAYVYSPISDLTTDDVWTILLSHYNSQTPWGTSNNELFGLYAEGSGDSGECPFIADQGGAKSTCGNSRFGCWICTVVQEDKSLNGFIQSGHEWMIPLAEFRKWILSIRDVGEYRKKHKRNGSIHLTKKGDIAYGPFTFEARQLILKKILETQLKMKEVHPDLELITMEELKAIDEIWDNEEDLTRTTLSQIYKDVTGKELPWASYKQPIFDDIALDIINEKCNEHDISSELFNKLLIDTNTYKHFSNNTKLKNSVNKMLNQQWLHYDIIQKIEESEDTKELDNEDK
jgi:DNA sulfur modification protein DndC